MFVVVGECNDYVFVLDTDDGSCEMIKWGRLKASGVDYIIENHAVSNFAKFRMLYGLSDFYCIVDGYYSKSFVSFKCDIIKKDGVRFDSCKFKFYLRIIPKSQCSIPKSVYDGADYAVYITLYADSYAYIVSVRGNKDLQFIDTPYGGYKGILIPSDMIFYLQRLVDNQDLSGIFNAFDGLFSEKLEVQGKIHDNDWHIDIDSISCKKWYKF